MLGAVTGALLCLSMNVYHEARSGPIDDQLAVAHVVMNRVADRRYPDDVCAVVRQTNGENCQFSWYCDGRPDTPHEHWAWLVAVALAQEVLSGESFDNTEGALFYHAHYVDPYWNKRMLLTRTDDLHKFYALVDKPASGAIRVADDREAAQRAPET